jgi:putative SOS response-associated peptidase YedK
MCGRFVQAHSAEEYALHFGAAEVLAAPQGPSWNVAPTDRVYAVASHEGRRSLGSFRWGLVPWFADSPKVGSRHINARAETAATSPVFKDSFQRKRCLIPADGFYEWKAMDQGGKLAHFVYATDRSPLALAGLWASWKDPDGERLTTCTIITTTPNEIVAPIHNRMPAVLPADAWDRWLDPDNADTEGLRDLLGPAPDGTLTHHPVSSLVNSVKNNVPELIEPLR